MLGNTKPSVLLVGCGKMGGSLLQRWLSDQRFSSTAVIEPSGLPQEFQGSIVRHYTAAQDITPGSTFDLIILAVKPQVIREVCEGLKPLAGPQSLILSIAAGTPLALFEDIFGSTQAIVRTMPNTPAAIGKGAIVAVANAACTPAHKALADTALSGTGLVEWVEDENLMNAVTALSGSGPAYVFYLIEALEKAGTDIGLPGTLAAKLARQTVIGSAALAESTPTPRRPRCVRTSPAPAAPRLPALEVLMNGEFQENPHPRPPSRKTSRRRAGRINQD
ncbi:MAG: pyrroline-5-carboxylate reductase [Alphaproteobacteria bacterium]|nr:pyrroline-5-carboxylate reductase [Alphaproteobacteria bacterium]